MWKSDVRVAYTNLWTVFVRACEQSNCIVRPRLFPEAVQCEKYSAQDSRPSLRSVLWIKNIPFNAGKGGDSLDLLIHATEVFSLDFSIMEESRVTVSYLHQKDREAQLLQSIHYDYEGKPESAHPWFHAQFGSRLPSAEEQKRIKFDLSINKINETHVKTLRIATAHMGIVSVLAGLAADHLKKTHFRAVFSAIRKNIDALPIAIFDRMQERLCRKPLNFLNLQWYDETH